MNPVTSLKDLWNSRKGSDTDTIHYTITAHGTLHVSKSKSAGKAKGRDQSGIEDETDTEKEKEKEKEKKRKKKKRKEKEKERSSSHGHKHRERRGSKSDRHHERRKSRGGRNDNVTEGHAETLMPDADIHAPTAAMHNHPHADMHVPAAVEVAVKSAAPRETAAVVARTNDTHMQSQEKTHKSPYAIAKIKEVFPKLTWEGIWGEKQQFPGSSMKGFTTSTGWTCSNGPESSLSRVEQHGHPVVAGQAGIFPGGTSRSPVWNLNVQGPGRENGLHPRSSRNPGSSSFIPQIPAPGLLTLAFHPSASDSSGSLKHPLSSVADTHGSSTFLDLQERNFLNRSEVHSSARVNLQNQLNRGHRQPISTSSFSTSYTSHSVPPTPPPHRTIRQSLGPVLLSVSVDEGGNGMGSSSPSYRQGGGDVDYEVSGLEVDRVGRGTYQLQEMSRRPGGSWTPDRFVSREFPNRELSQNPVRDHKGKNRGHNDLQHNDNHRGQGAGLAQYTKSKHLELDKTWRIVEAACERGEILGEVRTPTSTPEQGGKVRKRWGFRGIPSPDMLNDEASSPESSQTQSSPTPLQLKSLVRNERIEEGSIVVPESMFPESTRWGSSENDRESSVIPTKPIPVGRPSRYRRGIPYKTPVQSYSSGSSGGQSYNHAANQASYNNQFNQTTTVPAGPDGTTRNHRIVQYYSDFDYPACSSDGKMSYPSVPSFETLSITSPSQLQASSAFAAAPGSMHTTPNNRKTEAEAWRQVRGSGHNNASSEDIDGIPFVRATKAKPVHLAISPRAPHNLQPIAVSSAGSISYSSSSARGPTETNSQESQASKSNSPYTPPRAPIQPTPTTTPIPSRRRAKGPAPAFEGIVDLDPAVTMFNTVRVKVKTDISPKVGLQESKCMDRLLRVWNGKTNDDREIRKLSEAEQRK